MLSLHFNLLTLVTKLVCGWSLPTTPSLHTSSHAHILTTHILTCTHPHYIYTLSPHTFTTHLYHTPHTLTTHLHHTHHVLSPHTCPHHTSSLLSPLQQFRWRHRRQWSRRRWERHACPSLNTAHQLFTIERILYQYYIVCISMHPVYIASLFFQVFSFIYNTFCIAR